MGKWRGLLFCARLALIRALPLLLAGVASLALLALFAELQDADASIIRLPVQWLWVSVLPLLLVLALGGYIKKFKGAGVEFEPGMGDLPYAQPGKSDSLSTSAPVAAATPQSIAPTRSPSAAPWQEKHDAEYARTQGLFVVHVYKSSIRPSELYDITVFLMRHVKGSAPNQVTGFTEIDRAEFYFGPSWHDEVFVAHNVGGYIGVRTSAWGTFLASCRVTFKDPSTAPLVLHRYVDFEMRPREA